MNAIFVVIKAGGEYDDKWEEVVVSSFDKVKCEQYIVEKTEENKKALENCKKIQNWRREYDSKNPFPPMPNVNLKKTKWPSGLRKDQITDEMRAERERQKAENDVIMDAWRNFCEEYGAKLYSLLDEYKNSLGIKKDFNEYASNYDCEFYIKEIEVI